VQIDALVNDLLAHLAKVTQSKDVPIPALGARVDDVQRQIDAIRSRRVPRELTVTAKVAQKTVAYLDELFKEAKYSEVVTEAGAWTEFLRGKQVDEEARAYTEKINVFRQRAKTLSEFGAIAIRVTGTIVDARDPKRSSALVNDRLMRMGEKLDENGDVVIGRILPNGVEFHYKDEVVRKDRETGSAPLKPKAGKGRSASSVPARPTR
jgi:hypothetical protein